MSSAVSNEPLPWLPFRPEAEAALDAAPVPTRGGRHRAVVTPTPGDPSAAKAWTYLGLRGLAVSILAWLASLLLWSMLPMAAGLAPNLVESGSMSPAINTGDVVLTASVPTNQVAAQIRPGMVALVHNPAQPGRMLLHRVREVDPDGTVHTKGDANANADSSPVPADGVKGIGRVRVPFVGLPMTWLQHGQVLWALAALAGLIALAVVAANTEVTRLGTAGLVAALVLTPLTVIGAHSTQAVFTGTTTPSQASGARSGEFPAQSIWWAGDNSWSQTGASDLVSNWRPAAVTSPSSTGWTAVAASYDRTCAIRSPGTMWCWGVTNDNSAVAVRSTAAGLLPTQVGSATTWTAVSAGTDFTCGLQSDNSLWCWGSNYYGQLGIGSNTDQRYPAQVSGTWSKVGVGAYHACGIKTDGSLWCWGANDRYQLGNGTTTNSSSPAQVGTATNWTTIAGGNAHECGLRGAGTLWCWGYNSSGQVGTGNTTNQPTPIRVGAASNWTTIGLGDFHTCVASTTTIQCMGWNYLNQLGDGTGTDHYSLTAVNVSSASWTSIGGDYASTCARRSDAVVYCWGNNTQGEDGTGAIYSMPTPAATTGTWSLVAMGGDHACALTNTGSGLSCWGRNDFGQLGKGRVDYNTIADPVPAASGANWTSFGIGKQHGCGVKSDGTLWCMGNNYWGNLGLNDTTSRGLPTQVGTGTKWVQVAANDSDTCAIQTDTTLWCWGWNGTGQLGLGDTAARSVPTQVTGTGWSQVSLGFLGGCAVKIDGTVYCWGYNTDGQVGNNTTGSNVLSPMLVSGTNFKTVSYTGYHACGLKRDNTLSCWGYNGDGQLGDTTTTSRSTPVQVSGAWTAVSVGGYYTCGLKTAGSVWCWGNNYTGQLGNGTTTSNATPAQVTGGWTDVTQISVGNGHACAVRSGAGLWCWGQNNVGQLGTGAVSGTGNQTTPVAFSKTATVTRIYAGFDITMVITASQSYEAENGTLTHCIALTATASGGRHVGYMDYSDSSVDFTVVPPAAGTYTVKIYYDNGGSSATQTLTINGGGSQTITYPSTSPGYGVESPSQYVTATVTFTAGTNHLVLTRSTNSAELDRISVG